MRIIIASLLCVATLSAVITLVPQVTPHNLCSIFNENGACVSCVKGFKLQNGVCVESLRNCKAYDTINGVCLTCYIGYKLTSDSACEADQSVNLLQGCSKEYNEACVECAAGYYFNYDNVCEPIEPLCQKFNYHTKSCQQCKFGFIYRANEGNCRLFDDSNYLLPHCISYNFQGGCIQCHNGYFHQGMCLPGNPSCRTHHPQDPNSCTSCFRGFSLIGNRCLAVQENSLCKKFDIQGNCEECLFKTVKNAAGICIAVNPVCLTADINQECLTCHPGYVISGSTCVPQEKKSVNPLCGLWSGASCLDCQGWTHVNEENLCKPLSKLCKDHNSYTGECYICHNGWMSNYRGGCVPEFDKPIPDAINRPDGTTAACETWNQYKPELGKCVIQDLPCLEAGDDGKCRKCFQGYYLDPSSGKCKGYHPYCQDFDIITKKCNKCYEAFEFEGYTCVKRPRKPIQY